jgi:hypothetical protein
MADNRNKDQNQNKQQPPMQKPDRSVERQDGNRQQSGNRAGGGVDKDLDKGVGNENREIQKDLDTDETDEDEQGEITQRNPRMGEDNERK